MAMLATSHTISCHKLCVNITGSCVTMFDVPSVRHDSKHYGTGRRWPLIHNRHQPLYLYHIMSSYIDVMVQALSKYLCVNYLCNMKLWDPFPSASPCDIPHIGFSTPDRALTPTALHDNQLQMTIVHFFRATTHVYIPENLGN